MWFKQKFNPLSDNFDYVSELDSPLLFKWEINLPADFPTSAEVENGWFYTIWTDVTDNDVTKTNTGASFKKDDEIAWNGTDWTVIWNWEAKKENTITVAKSGGDYDTIQDAIDNSVNWDVIRIYPWVYTEALTSKAGIKTILVGVGDIESIVIKQDADTCITIPSDAGTSMSINNIKIESSATGNNSSKLISSQWENIYFNNVLFDYSINNGYTERIIELLSGNYLFNNCRFEYVSTGTQLWLSSFIYTTSNVKFNIMQGFGNISTDDTNALTKLCFVTNNSTNDSEIKDFDINIEAKTTAYAGTIDFVKLTESSNFECVWSNITIEADAGAVGSIWNAFAMTWNSWWKTYATSNKIYITGFESNYYWDIATGETLYSHFNDIVASNGKTGAGDFVFVDSPSNGNLQMSWDIAKTIATITADYDDTESWKFWILQSNAVGSDITATFNTTEMNSLVDWARRTFFNNSSSSNLIIDPNTLQIDNSILKRAIYSGGFITIEKVWSEFKIVASENISFNIELADIANKSFHVDFSDASSVTTSGADITQVDDKINSWAGTPSSTGHAKYGTTTQNSLNTAYFDENNSPISFGDVDIHSNLAGRGLTIIAVVKSEGANDTIMSKYFDWTPQREWRFYTNQVYLCENLDASGSEAIVNYSSNYDEWEILMFEWEPNNKTKVYKNGFLLGTSSYSLVDIGAGTANLLMGASDEVANDFRWEIGEVIALSDTLTESERTSLFSKLGAKWDIDISFPSSVNQVFWERNDADNSLVPAILGDNIDVKNSYFKGLGNFTPDAIDTESYSYGTRVTTTQMDAMTGMTTGAEIYNITENAPYYYDWTVWKKISDSSFWIPVKSSIEIDWTTNAINTNIQLYTATSNVWNISISICNRNNSVVNVRLAHIDGAIGDIADEDYILYDVALQPYETKTISVDWMINTDTFLIRSDTVDVNFTMNAQTGTSIW